MTPILAGRAVRLVHASAVRCSVRHMQPGSVAVPDMIYFQVMVQKQGYIKERYAYKQVLGASNRVLAGMH